MFKNKCLRGQTRTEFAELIATSGGSGGGGRGWAGRRGVRSFSTPDGQARYGYGGCGRVAAEQKKSTGQAGQGTNCSVRGSTM